MAKQFDKTDVTSDSMYFDRFNVAIILQNCHISFKLTFQPELGKSTSTPADQTNARSPVELWHKALPCDHF
jgi:hypothetical protein